MEIDGDELDLGAGEFEVIRLDGQREIMFDAKLAKQFEEDEKQRDAATIRAAREDKRFDEHSTKRVIRFGNIMEYYVRTPQA